MQILRIIHQLYIRILLRILFRHPLTSIGGTIQHKNNLQFIQGLMRERFQTTVQMGTGIVHRHNYTDLRLHFISLEYVPESGIQANIIHFKTHIF